MLRTVFDHFYTLELFIPQNHRFGFKICSMLACKWCGRKHKLCMHPYLCTTTKIPSHTHTLTHAWWQWQRWRDWDISGCGGSGSLIREMKLDWEEGWEERTRKDKTERGQWETEKKSKKKRESDKPLSYEDEQTDRKTAEGSVCSADLRRRWSGGRVSYSRVQTEHIQRNKVTPRQRKKEKEGVQYA